SDPDNALVSTDGKVTGFFEASDHDYGTFDAYKWQLWNVENGWYPGGVEDPNLLSRTFEDPQNILMLGKGEAYYDFRDLYQQVSGESASKANTQNLMILGSTVGSLGAIRLAGLARTEAGLLASNPASYFYSQGYKLTLMADEAVAGLAGFPTGAVFGGGGAMLLDDMVSGGSRYATALLDDASSLGVFGRGVDSNPGQFRFFEVPGGVHSEFVVPNKVDDVARTVTRNQSWFDDVAINATRKPDSNRLVLGHFAREGTSYQKVAAHYEASYFKVDDWNSVTKGLSNDEIWRINETFLDQQVMQGKKILFSHNPSKARPNSFFEREVNYLQDLGYQFKQKNQWTWEAIYGPK
ncbi:hypothetical protein PSI07_22260, partial [Pseudoalteromonas sp. GABNS16A]|uniref:hypothetical protein n=1 Tax=Pseudoalteromonas sp. GABNS16A TaxID=3025321 RepID=UPI0023596126